MSNFERDAAIGDFYAVQLKRYFEKHGKDNWFQDNIYPGNAIKSQYPGIDNISTTYSSVEGEPAWQRLYDVDWIVSDGNGQRQTHEVKWSGATHDSARPTQNILIETVSSDKDYDGKTFAYYDSKKKSWNTDWVENPKTGKKEKILRGVGWYRKREKVLRQEADGTEHIITDENDMADWFHFYCTIDPKKQLTATRGEIEAFKNAPNIPDGALLLTKFPIDYCISIQGQYLKCIVEKFLKAGGRERDVRGSKGYLIPVGEIVNSSVYNEQGIQPARFYNPAFVKVNFVSDDCWIRHGSGQLDLYSPQRFREELGVAEGEVKQRISLETDNGIWHLGDGFVTAYQRIDETGEATFADGSRTAKAAKVFQSEFRHDIEIPQFQLDWLLGFTNKFEVK